MEITLEKLKQEDAVKLYEFELANRDFFESMVPSRGEEYYNLSHFHINHKALLKEQADGHSYFYLIKDKSGSILGRINLVDIDLSQKQGHVGYRVGKNYAGKGIANKALGLFLQICREKGIKQINAQTTTNNIGSQKILEKNEFKYISTSNEEFEMNGNILKFVYYKWEFENR
ncbi:GNAT family N-acetyltransferase [Bacillus sp. m3-13]|uniref:GNAT family N-acetyltransferase n=1 Tax=Bacillus sp. m3-13 TaxID=406124 RepID=UPI0001E89013|nr:GNAT family N-acetyltransferase [Bacillus sp. m3-13]